MQTVQISQKNNIRWSLPMGLKQLANIFEVHRNTMSNWLKNQIICNRQISPRKWRVAVFELPNEMEDEQSIEKFFS